MQILGPDEISGIVTGFAPRIVNFTPDMIDDEAVLWFNEKWKRIRDGYPGEDDKVNVVSEFVKKLGLSETNTIKNMKDYIMLFEEYLTVVENMDRRGMEQWIHTESGVDDVTLSRLSDDELLDTYIGIKKGTITADNVTTLVNKYDKGDKPNRILSPKDYGRKPTEQPVEKEVGELDDLASDLYAFVSIGDLAKVSEFPKSITDGDKYDLAREEVMTMMGGPIYFEDNEFADNLIGLRLTRLYSELPPEELAKYEADTRGIVTPIAQDEFPDAAELIIRTRNLVVIEQHNNIWYMRLLPLM